MSSPDPFRAVPKKPRVPVQPDGRRVVGETPYRTCAGHITGLDWDALRPSDSDECGREAS